MTDHLVAFEYGTGQVWGYIRARSTADIEALVPEVDVYEAPPAWMGDGEIRSLREHAVYVSDGALQTLMNQRVPVA
jgi:hypothetical protein